MRKTSHFLRLHMETNIVSAFDNFCCICFENSHDGLVLECGHLVDYKCFTSWFRRCQSSQKSATCPMCRAATTFTPPPFLLPIFQIRYPLSYNYALADWGMRNIVQPPLSPPYKKEVVQEFCANYIGVWNLLGDIPNVSHPQILVDLNDQSWAKLVDVFRKCFASMSDACDPYYTKSKDTHPYGLMPIACQSCYRTGFNCPRHFTEHKKICKKRHEIVNASMPASAEIDDLHFFNAWLRKDFESIGLASFVQPQIPPYQRTHRHFHVPPPLLTGPFHLHHLSYDDATGVYSLVQMQQPREVEPATVVQQESDEVDNLPELETDTISHVLTHLNPMVFE